LVAPHMDGYQAQRSGIPHLAKNERDDGAPIDSW
jgi:hypothetical protein